MHLHTASEIDLAYLVWGSFITEYLSNINLNPFKYISSISLAYEQHLQEEGGENDLLALISNQHGWFIFK